MMCSCGDKGTCARSATQTRANRCNCDSNDDVWREDSGSITNKADLPITYFQAGDTGWSGT